ALRSTLPILAPPQSTAPLPERGQRSCSTPSKTGMPQAKAVPLPWSAVKLLPRPPRYRPNAAASTPGEGTLSLVSHCTATCYRRMHRDERLATRGLEACQTQSQHGQSAEHRAGGTAAHSCWRGKLHRQVALRPSGDATRRVWSKRLYGVDNP